MKVRAIQVISSIEDEASGPSYSVVRLAQEIAAMNYDSLICSLSRESAEYISERVLHYKYPLRRGPFGINKRIEFSTQLRDGIANNLSRNSVIHAHGLWRMPGVYAARIAARAKQPFILSPRGMLGPAALEFSWMRKRAFWYLVQQHTLGMLTCVHVTSLAEAEEVRSFGIRAPIAVIPNGIDVPASPAAPRDTKNRYILYLGRIHPKKGLKNLLFAWSAVQASFASWELRIAGPSELSHAQELKKLAYELGLSRISFLGPVYSPDKERLYAGASAFVLPTRNENFGMVVAEALSQECPVICTKDAPWKGLNDRQCGWWIDGDVESMASAMQDAMTISEAARQDMGLRAVEWMRNDFAWSNIASAMGSLYRWTLRQGAIPNFVQIN